MAHTRIDTRIDTRIHIHEADFDVGAELAALHADAPGVGAVASFLGTVRAGQGGAAVDALTLEHYPGMTERAIAAMVVEARARWPLAGVRIIHRVGRLGPGERIVLVAVASAHRLAAFEACEFLMDYLKTQAPFWKKEHGPQGAQWVDAREADDAALARWGVSARNAPARPQGTAGDASPDGQSRL